MNDQAQGTQPPTPTPPGGGQPPVPPADNAGANTGAQPGGQTPPPPTPQPAPAQPPQGAPAPQPATNQTPPPPPPGSGQLPAREKHIFTIPPHPNTQFDEAKFLELLEGSISLTLEEKKRVIDAIPRLSVEQINELLSIFTEERQKFAELEQEFSGDVEKLKAEREKEIEMEQVRSEESAQSEEDTAKADEIKKQMGL